MTGGWKSGFLIDAIVAELGVPTFVRFASNFSAQCKLYNAAYYDPWAAGVDAFAQPLSSWVSHFNFCNPSWPLLGQLYQFLLRHQNVRAIVIMPAWPTASWYKPFLRLASKVVVLPRRASLFTAARSGRVTLAPPAPWPTLALLLESRSSGLPSSRALTSLPE